MFKRRDFVLLHGREGAASDDSSDEDDDDDDRAGAAAAAAAGDSGAESGSEGSDTGEEEGEESEEDDAQDDEQEPEPKKETRGGTVWRCLVCPKALLLNAKAVEDHAASKKHVKAVRRHGGDDADPREPIVPAEVYHKLVSGQEDDDSEEDEAFETHGERLARLRAERLLREEAGEDGPGAKSQMVSDSDEEDGPGGAKPAGNKKPSNGRRRQALRRKKKAEREAKRAKREAGGGVADPAAPEAKRKKGDAGPARKKPRKAGA